MKHLNNIKLRDGKTMPLLGLGLWGLSPGKETYNTVKAALKGGYRLFDTAEMYGNEKDLGLALKDFEIKRKDVFITSKLWDCSLGENHVFNSFEKSLEKLNLNYIDLYLIHWPKNGFLKAWNAFERIQKQGLIKSIGVSNFSESHLAKFFDNNLKIPVVNQIEFNPFLQQTSILNFCKKKQIHLTGYCPLARGKKLNNKIIKKIAKEKNKTPAQIMIRWSIQKKITIIPKSCNPKRLEENYNIFNFNLDQYEMKVIDNLDEGLRFCPDPLEIKID